MNKDEMLKMFGLKEKPKETVEKVFIGQPTDLTYPNLKHAQCLKLDEWDIEKGKQLKEAHPTIELDEEGWADFHAAAYLMDPELEEGCTNEFRYQFLQTLMETPEYASLHQDTRLSTVASGVAAVDFAREFVRLQTGQARGKAKERGSKPGMGQQMALLRAAGRAVAEAADDVEELHGICNALGMGGNGANKPQSLDAKKIADTYNKVRNNAMLKRILELAGRYRRLAQAKQRQKATHGYDDMVGVELSGDVGRVLPIELVQLADPDFELDAMRRLVERQSMSRQYRGIEKVGKGPIVVCVDESGSMSGEKVANAKAFALAMAWIARHQGRWCALCGYSGGTEGTKLILPPNKWDESALMDWLTHFFSGGTEMDVPLEVLPTKWWDEFVARGMRRGKTDVILLTDAQCYVPPEMEKQFNDWKVREKVKTISLIIGGWGGAGGLEKVSDETYNASSISLQEAGIERCLSL